MLFSFFSNLFWPYRSLNFANMSLMQKEHAKSGLANTAANCLRELAIEKSLVPIEILSLFHASKLELSK